MVQSIFSLWTGKMAKTKVEPLQVIEVEDIDENAKKGNIVNNENETSGMCEFYVMHHFGFHYNTNPINLPNSRIIFSTSPALTFWWPTSCNCHGMHLLLLSHEGFAV